ncbi:MAG: fluoride efflux transporter CrcB [Proteobacteria bacterium]|nr:fluoride efflux transporter CrcB [Pseudomonadota bacterium]MDA0995008.1 fluoride efflux transporter CrcB [Pseudomonadota bacterium]
MKIVFFNAALVGAGGFIGAIFRYGLSGFVQRSSAFAAFPYGTLAVNMLGCLLIGITVGIIDARQMINPELRSFVLVGVLGGFTTYSTFGLETFALLREADFLRAASNIAIHVILGLALVWLGYALASR